MMAFPPGPAIGRGRGKEVLEIDPPRRSRVPSGLTRVDDPAATRLTLEPFAGLRDTRYVLYFPVAYPDRIDERRGQLRAMDERTLAIASRTLDTVIAQSRACNEAAAQLGWSGATPFLTLAFLALSVIPSLKITDRGLVDVDRFEIVPLAV